MKRSCTHSPHQRQRVRKAFYEYYAENEKFVDIVTRMREECEVDARTKFELSILPPQLAGLWMSKYGYTTKVEEDTKLNSEVTINIELTDDE